MEETVYTPADTLAAVEGRLAELAARLSAQVEALTEQDESRRRTLDTREDELRRRELTAQAHELLQQRGLPAALADCLAFADEDALRRGVDALENAFRAAVQQGVEERLLTQDAPKSGAVKPLSEMTDEEYYAAVSRSN